MLVPVADEIARIKTSIRFDEPSLTKQSDRDSVDLNSIVAKYLRTGEAPGMKGLPAYGDYSASTTLHDSMNIVRDAEAAFASLPAEVRDACNNDPGALLDLVADPARQEEAIALGLIEAPEIAVRETLVAENLTRETGENPPKETSADQAD